MEWIVVTIIGAIIGTITAFASIPVRMPAALGIGLGIAGALLGGALSHITHFAANEPWTVYAIAALLSLGFEAGGVFGFTLTKSEERV